jgi:hypothetical protein
VYQCHRSCFRASAAASRRPAEGAVCHPNFGSMPIVGDALARQTRRASAARDQQRRSSDDYGRSVSGSIVFRSKAAAVLVHSPSRAVNRAFNTSAKATPCDFAERGREHRAGQGPAGPRQAPRSHWPHVRGLAPRRLAWLRRPARGQTIKRMTSPAPTQMATEAGPIVYVGPSCGALATLPALEVLHNTSMRHHPQ